MELKKQIIFVVVGRLGKSLTVSKVAPIVASGKVEKVYVFREETGFVINGIEYITLPDFIKNIKINFIKKKFRIIYEPLQLLFYAIKLKPDYINGVYTLPKGLNSFIVSKMVGCKSIVSVIGGEREILTYNKPTAFWKNFNLWLLRNCDIITTKGIKVKEYLIDNGIKKDKIFIFNGSVDTHKYFFNKKIYKDIDILFVGTFRRLKGPDRIVKMIHKLRNNYPNLKAVFLGKGYLYNEIKEQIHILDLQNNIELKGYRTDTVTFFQRAKVLVMPSRSEGLSTAMLEAMACGCVAVVSNVGNMTDAANNGVNSFVVDDYTDIDTFVKYIKILLKNPNRQEKMAQNALQTVNKKYAIYPQTMIAKQIIDYGDKL